MGHFKIQGAVLFNVFLLVLLLFTILHKNPSSKVPFLIAAFGGFFIDALSSLPLGAGIFGSQMAVLIVRKFLNLIFERNFLSMSLILFSGFAIYYFSVFAFASLISLASGKEILLNLILDSRIYLTIIFTSLFGTILYWLLTYLRNGLKMKI